MRHGLLRWRLAGLYTDDFWVESQRVNGGDTVSFIYDDDGLLTAAGALSLL